MLSLYRYLKVLLIAPLLASCAGGLSEMPLLGCSLGSESAQFRSLDESGSIEMTGVIDCSTEKKLKRFLQNHQLKTLVMRDVPGSADDDANLKLARFIASLNIKTVVPQGGVIASGGVDLFLAGKIREVEDNSVVAVHSWGDLFGGSGIEVYREDPGDPYHQTYITYYRHIVSGLKDGRSQNDINDPAEDFYVYTLQAAPVDGTHCMSGSELISWGIVTNDRQPEALVLGEHDYCTH